MNTCSLHFFCGLHAKWNVRDHTCSNGRMFGKRTATLWVRNMQRAEGPQAFENGYRKMLNEFSDDIPRTEYIHELYRDGRKAYFKQTLQFSNAVLVDVCEILFNAVKGWVLGSSRRSTTLFPTVVRITEGCRDLVSRGFLTPLKLTKKYVTKKTKNSSVLGLFEFLSEHLTHWSIVSMYDTLDKSWNRYNVTHVSSDDTMMITRK